MQLEVFTTGGTIDKIYFDKKSEFEVGDPVVGTLLEAMGISVEFSHHEGAPGQQEIDLRYADALTTADNIMTFRPLEAARHRPMHR